jgi:hypothetical protein
MSKRALPPVSCFTRVRLRKDFSKCFEEGCNAEELFEYVRNTRELWWPMQTYLQQMAGVRFERHGKMIGPITLPALDYDVHDIACAAAADFIRAVELPGVLDATVVAAAELAWGAAAHEQALIVLTAQGLKGPALGTALKTTLSLPG